MTPILSHHLPPNHYPFLQSSERMERWASAIALGRRKEIGVFATLQEMLLEDIFAYDFLVDESVDQTVEKAIKQWREDHFAVLKECNRAAVVPWEDRVDRVVVEAWEAGKQRVSEYDWYMCHRKTIALLLGAWGNPDAAPSLRHAFQVSWQIEQQPGPFSGRWGDLRESLLSLQDCLAYALGQLGVRNAFADANLPAARQRIALTYLIFGALQVQARQIFISDLAFLALSFTDSEQVSRTLEKQFGWSEEERAKHLQHFEWDCQERFMEGLL